MGRMQIVYRSIKDILPYEKNPRINDEAVPVVKESIKEFGFRKIDGKVSTCDHRRR